MPSRKLLKTLFVLASLLCFSSGVRADSTVTALTAASALTGTELLYCVQAAADRKCTISQVPAIVGTMPVTGGVAGNLLYTDGTLLQASGGVTWAGTGQLAIALGTITTNLKALNITGTWNNAGVTFDAPFFMNITRTANNAASKLIDLQVDSATTVFTVDNGGAVVAFSSFTSLNGSVIVPSGGTYQWVTPGDLLLFRVAPNVLGLGINSAVVGSYLQWAGQTRVTADVTNATTTLATVTGLSINVQAGRTYSWDCQISWTDAAAGGLQLAMSGTATHTNIIYDGWIVDSGANGIKGNAQAAAIGGVVASAVTTGTAGHAEIHGTTTVNAAGTFLVQFAENTSNATATTIKRGSFCLFNDMP